MKRQRGRGRSLFRFVASVLLLAGAAGMLIVAANLFGSTIVSAVGLPSALGDDERGLEAPAGPITGLTSAAVPRDCTPHPLAAGTDLAGTDPFELVLEASRRTRACADRVVVAGSDPSARWTAAQLASADGATFLLTRPGSDATLSEELVRLAPREVVAVGLDAATPAVLDGDWEVEEEPVDPAAQPPLAEGGPGQESAAIWVVGGLETDTVALLGLAAEQAQAKVIDLDRRRNGEAASDLLELDPAVQGDLRTADTLHIVGTVSELDRWKLRAIGSGVELPGGGLTILPDRRYIAFYGAPGTSALGVVGEQDPAATLERMRPLLAEYETGDGVVVVPTFELIATVAAAEAGDDGNYSHEADVASLRPYVDFAGDNGVYVLLDLQPGRTDFLTQAKSYEELLRLPHVGLALDPEWRLGPNQVHLRQFGSVDAAEVNEVSAWLAELVRANDLPEKMLLIHQFEQSMVTNRNEIVDRPELSLVIQMDGQGPLGSKYETLAALIRGGEDGPWRWGWKNFYDEDSPMATPAQTMAVVPEPVYVSYQ